MADARPTCPDCDIKGIEYIVSTPSTETSESGDPWFNVAVLATFLIRWPVDEESQHREIRPAIRH